MMEKLTCKLLPIVFSACMVLGLGGTLYAANTFSARHSALTATSSNETSSSVSSGGPREVTDTTTQVSCDVSALTLPNGVTEAWPGVGEIIESSVSDKIASLVKDIGPLSFHVLKTYRLRILNQSAIEFTDYKGLVKVRFPIPRGADGTLKVYRYDTTALTDMAAVKDGNYLQFFVHDMGYFVIVQSNGIDEAQLVGGVTEAPAIPETGAPHQSLLPIVIAGFSLIICVVYVACRRKRG
ncbi:hypothetical protein [Acetanaerobacterium elongatum]|uniref:Uncharacterized protein n=1 Tax=Acetanaerobacterium elongatum TaxID=258515 RepID=A0A1G9WNC7_9FIRM|nr:hypothetical protein [Acetanaerobacterium elongatum]SDM85867.1 hypothetical protein SAMN05192585_10665 [Acetanaerobacterium elongatum]